MPGRFTKELMVRSPNSMRVYDPLSAQQTFPQDWFATGDAVEIIEGRVYFVGRKSDMINVAGSKVFPIEVERVIGRRLAGCKGGSSCNPGSSSCKCPIIMVPRCIMGNVAGTFIERP